MIQCTEYVTQLLDRATALVDQLVRRDANVRICFRHPTNYLQHPLANILSNTAFGTFAHDSLVGLPVTTHAQGRRKNRCEVLVAPCQPRLFKPRDGGTNPIVVRRAVAHEVTVSILNQDLAAGCDYRVRAVLVVTPSAPVQAAQCPKNRLNVVALQP